MPALMSFMFKTYVWIPLAYATMILKLSDPTPRISGRCLTKCLSTLEWLCITLTQATPGQPSILVIGTPDPAPMHPKLTAAHLQKVQLDLPPHLGQLHILQGATKIAGQMNSGINEYPGKPRKPPGVSRTTTRKPIPPKRHGSIALQSCLVGLPRTVQTLRTCLPYGR
jgi:hypothetical protein